MRTLSPPPWRVPSSRNMHWLFDGNEMYDDWNDSVVVTIPKNIQMLDEDDGDVLRLSDSRLLGLKNSDNKVIAGVVNNSFKFFIADP